MANNPLQQYFRQPKLYINLPTKGVYSAPGTVASEKITVFGMTGIDEIIMKTPDALLSGDCISKVIKSCCPEIKDPYELSNVDIDCILIAIRIATYGSTLSASNTCENCEAENEYDIDLNHYMEHFKTCVFQSKVELDNMTIRLKPITYSQANDIGLENFILQKKLVQVNQIEDQTEQEHQIRKIFEDLSAIQQKLISLSVDQIEIETQMVSEKEYIDEFLNNCDKLVFDKIKEQFDINNNSWKIPTTEVVCDACNHKGKLTVELNQTNFFGGA